MRLFRITLLLASAVFLFSGFAAAQPAKGKKPAARAVAKKAPPTSEEIAQSGSFENGVYKNELLGFNITIPEGWDLTNVETNAAGLEAGRAKATANKSRQMAAAIDRSISRTRILFQTFNVGGGIGCGVETIPAPMTLSDYIAQNKKLVLSSYPGIKLTKDLYTRKLAGTAFTTFEVEIPKGGQIVRQIYMLTQRRKAMFFFVVTHLNDEVKETLLDSMDTLKLDK